MKKFLKHTTSILLITVITGGVYVLPAPHMAHATGFAFVQSKSASGLGTTGSVTLTNPATAGNLLVAFFAGSDVGCDTATITGWTALTGTGVTGGNPSALRTSRMFYKKATGGEQTVTTSVVTQMQRSLIVAEYSGVDATTQLDVENNVVTNSGTTHTTPTVTPASGVERLVIIATIARSAGLWSNELVNSSATGVNEREDTQSLNSTAQLSDLDVISTSGSYSGSADTSIANTGIAGIAIFSAAAAATQAPTVTTDSFSNVGATSATLNGTKTGGDNATEHGFAYSTDSTLSSGVSTTTDGALTSNTSYSDNISSLTASTVYYFRAYATNSGGTGYGSILNFTTSAPSAAPARIIRLTGKLLIHGNVRLH